MIKVQISGRCMPGDNGKVMSSLTALFYNKVNYLFKFIITYAAAMLTTSHKTKQIGIYGATVPFLPVILSIVMHSEKRTQLPCIMYKHILFNILSGLF